MVKVKIRVPKPNANFTGESMGIAFQNGVAKVEDKWLIQRFKESGYIVGEQVEKEAKQADQDNQDPKQKEVDYFKEDGSVDRLKGFEHLESLGVEFKKNISNGDLTELLKEHE